MEARGERASVVSLGGRLGGRRSWAAILRSVRWEALLVVLLVSIGVRWGIVDPVLRYAGLGIPFSVLGFWLLTLGLLLVVASGSLIVGHFSRGESWGERGWGGEEADRVGRLYLILSILSLLLVAYPSYEVGSLGLLLVVGGAAGLLWFYAVMYRRRRVLGVVIPGGLGFGVPVVPYLYHLKAMNDAYWTAMVREELNLWGSVRYAAIYGVALGFLCTVYVLIRRCRGSLEVVGGGAGVRGSGGGTRRAIGILLVLLMVLVVGLGYALYRARSVGFVGLDKGFTLLYLGILVLLPLVVSATLVVMGTEAVHMRNAGRIISFLVLVVSAFPLLSIIYFTRVYGAIFPLR